MGISTHILDVARGKPAADVPVTLEQLRDGAWHRVGEGRTDADGRVKSLLPAGAALEAGTFRASFAILAYVQEHHAKGFYPEVSITFLVENPAEHFHVPLLLSPWGYSTYRGS